MNTVLYPFRYAAYTSPVPGTTSIIGSYCHEPLHAHSGVTVLHVLPLSVERIRPMNAEGQLPGQGFGPPIRVTSAYTYGPFASAAIAGSQSSVVGSTTCSPVHPAAGAPATATALAAVPL